MATATAKKPNDEQPQPPPEERGSLRRFLEKAPPPSVREDEGPEPKPWEAVTFDDVDDEEIRGKSGRDVVALAAQRRQEAQRERDRAAQLERDLAAERHRREMEDIARRTVDASRQAPPAPQGPSREEQLVADINELWITDHPRAVALMNELTEMRANKLIETRTSTLKSDIMNEVRSTRINQDAQTAWSQFRGYLTEQCGVDGATVDRRMRMILAEVTDPNGRYWANGSLTNPRNLLAAWNTEFGEAKPRSAAAPSTAHPPDTSSAPTATPPGGGRPAPAAAPGGPKGSLSQKQIEARRYIAQRVGLDPDKLIERGRRRNNA